MAAGGFSNHLACGGLAEGGAELSGQAYRRDMGAASRHAHSRDGGAVAAAQAPILGPVVGRLGSDSLTMDVAAGLHGRGPDGSLISALI